MTAENGMVDIHAHILPCMDDGAASVQESLRLLEALSKQGITAVAATPHFYADRESPSEFFGRRQEAVSLLTATGETGVTVLTGAEVCYYQGISRTERLSEFAISQTGLLLLEMPFSDWTASVIKEVCSIQRDRGLQVVIAHIDRYFGVRGLSDGMEDMLRSGVFFQLNADALLDRKCRGAALGLLEDRVVHFVASDCHNMKTRAPRLNEAYSVIEKKLGRNAVDCLWEYSEKVLEGSDA